eukprot:COSAG04_NODE_165_length_21747_cov_200.788387_19_plen_695_part_00
MSLRARDMVAAAPAAGDHGHGHGHDHGAVVCGMLQHRVDDAAGGGLSLCTLQETGVLEITPLAGLCAGASARHRLALAQATVYPTGRTGFVVSADGRRHELTAAGRDAECCAEGWLGRLTPLAEGRQPPQLTSNDGTIGRWLRAARDARQDQLVRYLRQQPDDAARRRLLDSRASCGAGLGALHWAAAKPTRKHRACLTWLLRVGADPTVPGSCGRPVLHSACSAQAARILVAAGADPSAEDADGLTAAAAARDRGDAALAEWLEAAVDREVEPSSLPDDAADPEQQAEASLMHGAEGAAPPRASPAPVLELRGLDDELDGWYSLHALAGDDQRPTYTRVGSDSSDRGTVVMLGYRKQEADDGTGWWFVAAMSPEELAHAPRPTEALAEAVLAVASDSAASPELICAAWQRRVKTGCGHAALRFFDALLDTIYCQTVVMRTGGTLCLPSSQRGVIELLAGVSRWHQLGMAALAFAAPSPRQTPDDSHSNIISDGMGSLSDAAGCTLPEALGWLRSALAKVGVAKASLAPAAGGDGRESTGPGAQLAAALGSPQAAVRLLGTFWRGLHTDLARATFSGRSCVAAAETIRICDEALAETAEDDESATALRVLRAQAGLRRAAEREQQRKNQDDDQDEADLIPAQADVCAAALALHAKFEAAERAGRRVVEDPEVAARRRQHKRWWRRCQEARAAER